MIWINFITETSACCISIILTVWGTAYTNFTSYGLNSQMAVFLAKYPISFKLDHTRTHPYLISQIREHVGSFLIRLAKYPVFKCIISVELCEIITMIGTMCFLTRLIKVYHLHATVSGFVKYEHSNCILSLNNIIFLGDSFIPISNKYSSSKAFFRRIKISSVFKL